MATNYWTGNAAAVAQVDRVTVTLVTGGPSAGNTFQLKVNNEVIAEYEADTADSNITIATALVTAWNASTSPYATGITASDNGDGTLDLTADNAGEPFTVVPEVELSDGTDLEIANVTASAGPNHYDSAGNWSLNAVPTAGQDVVIASSAINILWGLGQAAVALNSFRQDKTHTGQIGLRSGSFRLAGSANTSRVEYRTAYLQIDSPTVDLGIHAGGGSPAGSQLTKIDNQRSGASVTRVHSTHAQALETGKTATQLLFSNAAAELYVLRAPGGVGVGIGVPGETPTMEKIEFSTNTGSDRLVTGEGLTVESIRQKNGTSTIQATGEVTSITVDGGDLTTLGDFALLTLTANAGNAYPNHVSSDTGNDTETVTLEGGNVDFSRSAQPRAVGTLNPNRGSYKLDSAVVSVGTNNLPSGLRTVSVAA